MAPSLEQFLYTSRDDETTVSGGGALGGADSGKKSKQPEFFCRRWSSRSRALQATDRPTIS